MRTGLLSAARRRQSVRATVHAVSAVNYLAAAARRTKLVALAAERRRATRLALAVIVAVAALVAALYSPLQAATPPASSWRWPTFS